MSNRLMAGAGGAHITPPIGFPMGGYGARDHGAEGVHDQLNTHALFLDDGSTQVLVVASDLLGLRAPQVARVRELVTEATGVPAGHVFLACSHTHGGPLMYSDFAGFSAAHEAYLETLYHYIAGAALQAANAAIPVRYGHARREVRLGANRRERQADGTTKIGVDLDAPVAPWTDVICFDRADGSGTLECVTPEANSPLAFLPTGEPRAISSHAVPLQISVDGHALTAPSADFQFVYYAPPTLVSLSPSSFIVRCRIMQRKLRKETKGTGHADSCAPSVRKRTAPFTPILVYIYIYIYIIDII